MTKIQSKEALISTYTSDIGTVFASFQDYCNSDEVDPDIKYMYLRDGRRVPQNEKEQKWKEEAEKISRSGKSFELSFN